MEHFSIPETVQISIPVDTMSKSAEAATAIGYTGALTEQFHAARSGTRQAEPHAGDRRRSPLAGPASAVPAPIGTMVSRRSEKRQRSSCSQGSAAVRHVLVEAGWTAVRAPGPLRAFYERVRARRGAQVAAVATARKLASLCWCLLTREQDYAFGQPSLTRKKTRRLELAAGARRRARARSARATGCATRASVTPSARSPSRPRTRTAARSATGRRRDRRARA
jgi:hypothetical protein